MPIMLPMTSIIRQATRKPDEPYNILCGPTHERYETNLAKTGHNFYAFGHQSFKTWNTDFAPVPDNYHVLKPGDIPKHLKFDFIISGNKFGQFQVLGQLARQMHLPLISVEHTLPFVGWDEKTVEQCRRMRGHINIFISDYSIGQWGWSCRSDTQVIHHGLDTELFAPRGQQRENVILSVVNDWINRDWCCGYHAWTRISKNLPVKVLGSTHGLSKPAESTDDLINTYGSSRIFLNTSTISPVPMSLMEAMSCGCAVVSKATCMIPEIIENGKNGFISNDEAELRAYLEKLLADEDLAAQMGEEARKTIQERFGLDRFTDKWNTVFDIVGNTPYLG